MCDVYHGPPSDLKINAEYQDIIQNIRMENERGQYQFSRIFKRDEGQTGKRILLAYGMQFMNQIGGINLVV